LVQKHNHGTHRVEGTLLSRINNKGYFCSLRGLYIFLPQLFLIRCPIYTVVFYCSVYHLEYYFLFYVTSKRCYYLRMSQTLRNSELKFKAFYNPWTITLHKSILNTTFLPVVRYQVTILAETGFNWHHDTNNAISFNLKPTP
jgi:hypothetical protein